MKKKIFQVSNIIFYINYLIKDSNFEINSEDSSSNQDRIENNKTLELDNILQQLKHQENNPVLYSKDIVKLPENIEDIIPPFPIQTFISLSEINDKFDQTYFNTLKEIINSRKDISNNNLSINDENYLIILNEIINEKNDIESAMKKARISFDSKPLPINVSSNKKVISSLTSNIPTTPTLSTKISHSNTKLKRNSSNSNFNYLDLLDEIIQQNEIDEPLHKNNKESKNNIISITLDEEKLNEDKKILKETALNEENKLNNMIENNDKQLDNLIQTIKSTNKFVEGIV